MGRGGLINNKQVGYWDYDFARDAGAIGMVTMAGPNLPVGAIVDNGIVKVETAVTSAGAPTVALHITAAQDVLAETLKGALTLNALIDAVPDAAASAVSVATAAKGVTLTIGVAVLTAGKIVCMLEYYVPTDD